MLPQNVKSPVLTHINEGPHAHIVQQPVTKKGKQKRLENANIISWNVNTLSKEDSSTWIFGTMSNYRPNVICFQETLLNKEDSDLFKMSGFNIFPSPAASSRPKKGENRGLIVAVSKDFISEWAPSGDRLKMGGGIETQSIRVYGSNDHVTIHNVYVHHESPNSSLCLDLPKGNHVIVGDFNARHSEWEPNDSESINSPRGKALHPIIMNAHHLVLANQPKVATTIHGTTPSLSLVSSELAASADWQVLEGSPAKPHMPTLTSIQFESPSNTAPFKPRFIYRNADYGKLKSLTNEYVSPPNNSTTLENRLTTFTRESMSAASQSIPATKSHDKVAPWDCWWFTEECREAKSKLQKAVKSFMNNTTSRAELRKVRAETLSVYSKAKSEEWNTICQGINLNSSLSSQWRRLRWLYNGGQPPKRSLILDPQTRANEAMSFFADRTKLSNLNYAAKKLFETLHSRRKGLINEAIDTLDQFDNPFTPNELELALKPAKDSTPGNDEISFLILSNLGIGFKNELLVIINQSWQLRRLPDQWKLIPIIPIPKKDPGEYRPIALLSCICKVMERMVLARLKFQVGPLHPNLVGGVTGRGTTDAIATVTKLASDARHRRSGPTTQSLKHCYALFIDFEKAFELANSEAILHILAAEKGIKGNMLAWLSDFLVGRKGYTIVQGVESDPLVLENGTPQGSVLSPFLFNILIDYLLQIIEVQLGPSLVPKLTIIAYADDIVLVSNHAFASLILSKAAYALELASYIIGLKINTTKTKSMAWTHSHFLPNFSFQFYNKPVERVRTFKYLGVVLDDQLSFIQHARYIAGLAQRRLNILKHMAGSPYGATQTTLIRYVQTCIRPILEYGNIIHPIARVSALKILETTFNAALRIALRLPKHTPNVLLYAESGLSRLNDRSQALVAVSYSKIKAQSNSHPFFHERKNMHMDLWMFQKGSKLTNDMPLEIALETILQKLSIPPLDSIEIPPTSPLDPPVTSIIKFNITPLPKPKESYSATELVCLKEEISNRIQTMYSLEDQVYVDGSVDMETGKAAAAYIFKPKQDEHPIMEHFRITNWVSSTQAELGAIFKVLEKILITQTNRSVVILCDSMAALLSIQSKPNILDPLTYDIVRLAAFLVSNRKIDIIMHWIPSHIGIEYNEKVDEWAKQGTSKSSIDFEIPCTVGQIKSLIKRTGKKSVKTEFSRMANSFTPSNPSSKLPELAQWYRNVNPKLAPQIQISSNPKIQRDINRLRLGVDSWCFIHQTYMKCGYCKLQFTREHYLCICPVTASDQFLQSLTPEEHALPDKEIAAILLYRFSKPQYAGPLLKALSKYPISIECKNRNHGKINYDYTSIPPAL